jgi:hypothetical protein
LAESSGGGGSLVVDFLKVTIICGIEFISRLAMTLILNAGVC